jgi:DNA topoisomerase IB
MRSPRPSRQSARLGSPARAALVPTRAARLAGLRYVGGEAPGIRRVRAGRGFRYLDARGKTHGARNVTRAIEQVASKLGNTVAVCRRSYVHPAVIEGYLDGSAPAAGCRSRATAGS